MSETDNYTQHELAEILNSARVIAVVGASAKPDRPSFRVMKTLLDFGFDVIPVNPGQVGTEIHGRPVVARLADIDRTVNLVDVFRPSAAAFDVTREAIDIGAKVVWMQVGIRNEAAAELAREAGLRVVMDRCTKTVLLRQAANQAQAS